MKEIVITSSVLILVLLGLRLIFAKKVRRTLIYASWLLVALRLLIPIQFGQLDFSVLTAAKPMTQVITNISEQPVAGVSQEDAYRDVLVEYVENDRTVFMPEIQDQIQSAIDSEIPKDEIVEMLGNDYSEQEIFVPEVQPQVQQKVEEAASPITLGQIATILWLAGMAVMAVWLSATNLRLSRSLKRSAQPLDCESPIPVYVSENAKSPCLVGSFRPRIYLTPESAADDGMARHVLTHELTHYAHKDHIWALIRCVCLCVYWFNPLVWAAAWFSRRDCELACDEGALKRLGEEERIAYGKSLLCVVSHASVSGRLMLTATTMAETKKQLKERIQLIARKPKWSIYAAIAMVLVCAIIAGCAAAGPTGDANDPTTPADPSEPKNSWEISDELKAQIKQDYVDYLASGSHTCTAEDVKLIVVSQVDSGIAMVIGCKCSGIDPDVSWDDLFGESAADLQFYTPDSWFLSFYKDGDFKRLDAAYNSRWLTYPELRTVWDDYHTQFPKALEIWKVVNPGLTEPPQRDSSGLDYAVNEDGTTCTITGMGVCTDVDVVIPETIDGYQVTAIGKLAFWPKNITSVVMPDSVVSIGTSAFEYCSELRSVVLSKNLTSIGIHAFNQCQNLTSISLPDSLTSIGGGAFSNCSALTSITIPAGVTSINSGTFNRCHKLVSVTLPEGLTDIGSTAFQSCTSLEHLTLPQSVTSIDHSAFQSSGLTSIVIPNGVTAIATNTFSYCTQLTEVTIPNTVTLIDNYAFWGCSGLQRIHLPTSVTEIGFWAFAECSSVTRITVAAGNSRYLSAGNCLIDTQEQKLILAANGAEIPTDGSVTEIGDYAFYGHTNLEQIVLPEGIRRIEQRAFMNCTNLAAIYLPVSMTVINCPFEGCFSPATIYYSGTTAQWRAISRPTYLGDLLQNFIVICTDGQLEIK